MAQLKDTTIDGNLSVSGTIETSSDITGGSINAITQLTSNTFKTNAITAFSGGTSGQISINSDVNMNTNTLYVNTINKVGNGTITINKGIYITVDNPSTFESSIFTTIYPHNLGYQRFQSTWLGFYNSCADAIDNVVGSRYGYLEMNSAGLTMKAEKSSLFNFINTTTWGGNTLRWNGDLYNSDGNGVAYLGLANNKWKAVYATNGTIQTSDRSAKSDIHYIDEPQPRLKTMSLSNTTKTSFTSDDVINFIKKLNPATFVYGDGTIKDALDTNNTDSVQLGLIADDIKDEPLFNYVGATCEYDDIIEPEERDEEGNVTKEAVTEKKITLGLKPIPLAVLALSCCKKLIEKVEKLESKIGE